MAERRAKIVERKDDWSNALSGLGTFRDKRRHMRFKPSALLPPEQCEWLFAQDDLCETIVSAIVDDGFREGWSLRPAKDPEAEPGTPEDPEAIARGHEIKTMLEDLEATETLRLGAIWGRLYGRGATLLVMAGQDPAEPIEPGELLDLVDLERRELWPVKYYLDPNEPKFGKVEVFNLTPFTDGQVAAPTVYVHESRLVLWGGADTPKRIRAMNEGCDLSVLQKVYEVLQDVYGNWGSVCAALADMSVSVLKMKGLIDAVAAGQSANIMKRVELMNLTKGVVNGLLLDADGEEFDYAERGALSGIKDVLDSTWQRLASAARMPVTRLMGISPAGMNATGESDTNFWYDRVRAWQRNEATPAILSLVGLIDAGNWEVVWADLEKMNPKEEAELRKSVADTDAVYIDKAVLLAEEVFKVRFGTGQWKAGYDGLDASTREKALAKELEAMEQHAGEPEPVPGIPGATPGQAQAEGDGSQPPGKPGAEVPPAGDKVQS